MPAGLEKISDSELELALARNDFDFYVEYTHRGHYQHARHTHYICNILNKVEKGIIDRLIITMPPRHSKSMTVSETFPSFFIGKDPERRVIEVSYGDALAQKFGRANRKKIEEYGPSIFNIQISKENASTTNWGIEGHRGGMISAGIGGSITGEGADLLLVDDPIKNREEAESEFYRERVWSEWQNTLLTRLHPNARIIVILTRWHEDDLAGRILAGKDKNQWTLLSLPAIAESGDLLGREEGEPLWPEHGYDKAWASSTKVNVGSRTWNSLYQQHPTPPEGGIIKREWLKFYNRLPEYFEQILLSFDCAFKDEKEAKSGSPDYVVGQAWGRLGGNMFLLDQVRARLNFPATLKMVQGMIEKWPQARAKLIEDKANGSAVISTLRDKISGIIPVEPEGGKVARLNAVSPDFESGNVYLPSSAIKPWILDYVEELVSFPNGAFDDQVDATSQALLYMSGRRTKVYSQKPAGW